MVPAFILIFSLTLLAFDFLVFTQSAVTGSSFPQGLALSPDGDLLGCREAYTKPIKMEVYRFIADSNQTKLLYERPSAGHCQITFAKNLAYIFYPLLQQNTNGEYEEVGFAINTMDPSTSKTTVIFETEANSNLRFAATNVTVTVKDQIIAIPGSVIIDEKQVPAIHVSQDLGKTFSSEYVSLDGKTPDKVTSVVIAPNQKWYIGANFSGEVKILESADQGKTYKEVYSGTGFSIRIFQQKGSKILALENYYESDIEQAYLLVADTNEVKFEKNKVDPTGDTKHQVWSLDYDLSRSAIAVTGATHVDAKQSYGTFLTLDFGKTWLTVDRHTGNDNAKDKFADAHEVVIDSAGCILTLGHERVDQNNSGQAIVRKTLNCIDEIN